MLLRQGQPSVERHVFWPGHHLQVLKAIVAGDTVDVVNDVALRDRAVRLLPDNPMGEVNLPASHCDMIPISVDPAALLMRLTHFLSRFRGVYLAKLGLPYPLSHLRRMVPSKIGLPKCLTKFFSCFRVSPSFDHGLVHSLPCLRGHRSAKVGLAHLLAGFWGLFMAETAGGTAKHALAAFLCEFRRSFVNSPWHLRFKYSTRWG